MEVKDIDKAPAPRAGRLDWQPLKKKFASLPPGKCIVIDPKEFPDHAEIRDSIRQALNFAATVITLANGKIRITRK